MQGALEQCPCTAFGMRCFEIEQRDKSCNLGVEAVIDARFMKTRFTGPLLAKSRADAGIVWLSTFLPVHVLKVP